MHVELIYPKFLAASQYAKNTFWKYIFEDLAYGRTPYGTYIVKNFICCNYKGKEFSYKIDEEKSGEELYEELYSILYNKFGLLSFEDKQNLRTKFEQTQEQNLSFSNISWNSIKKKNIKNLLIENFVIDVKKKYSLTFVQTRELLSYINIGLVFKTITADDINYSDGKIHSIDGFKFKKNKIIIDRDIFMMETSIQQPAICVKKKCYDNWDKYLLNFKKYKVLKN